MTSNKIYNNHCLDATIYTGIISSFNYSRQAQNLYKNGENSIKKAKPHNKLGGFRAGLKLAPTFG
jgi:hypothetical protein